VLGDHAAVCEPPTPFAPVFKNKKKECSFICQNITVRKKTTLFEKKLWNLLYKDESRIITMNIPEESSLDTPSPASLILLRWSCSLVM
jgi:hypothetical protein